MIQLFNSHASKNFTLVAKENPDVNFKVHLFVLSARSDFFRSMAGTPMMESR